MKIRFESNDDLPLRKIVSILVFIIAAGSVFKEDSSYYPQAHFCLYEFVMNYKEYTTFVQYTYHFLNHWYSKKH